MTHQEALEAAQTANPNFAALPADQRIAAVEAVYEVKVARQIDGVEIDHFFTGYPERDISAVAYRVPVNCSVSVSEIEDNPFEFSND